MSEELCGWLRGPGRWEDKQLVQKVGQVWMAYVKMMAPTIMDEQFVPAPGQQGAPPAASGGGGGVPTGGHKSVAAEAQDISAKADAEAEIQANPSGVHEG
jgi:hypothetical protein